MKKTTYQQYTQEVFTVIDIDGHGHTDIGIPLKEWDLINTVELPTTMAYHQEIGVEAEHNGKMYVGTGIYVHGELEDVEDIEEVWE